MINNSEHDVEHGVRSGRSSKPAGSGATQTGAYKIPTRNLEKKQRDEVKRTGAKLSVSKRERG